ncbi:hypothetical protein CDL12_20689 [Handroanthus impetiginosus]|uniref:Organ specific protein n=1 Tax=Handroanthus impetiginosus TaxID=429701 RepID=A0A2G9GNA0_9LAMI|nr:hypothetical protein CDL12_20689 [Handroanthus impetiginosus]
MEMRTFPSFLLLSLVLFAFITDARKDPNDYWKSRMKDEPMPKALKDLFHQNPTSVSPNSNHFVRNFETKASAIIYHNHNAPSEKSKTSTADGHEVMHAKNKKRGTRSL